MTLVKICGLTSLEDAKKAVELGADALGFIFAPSPRRVQPNLVRRISAEIGPLKVKVGVFVNERPGEILRLKEYCGLDIAQLHGDESEDFAAGLRCKSIKVIRVKEGEKPAPDTYPMSTLLLDTYVKGVRGGSGKAFNWKLAKDLSRQRSVILAGGLTPENVEQAIIEVRPYAVDVSSGVEAEPGRKDHAKLERFIRRAKGL